MQPSLKAQAKWLSSEPSIGPSAASSPNIATLAERFAEPLRGENGLADAAGEKLSHCGHERTLGSAASRREWSGAIASAETGGPPRRNEKVSLDRKGPGRSTGQHGVRADGDFVCAAVARHDAPAGREWGGSSGRSNSRDPPASTGLAEGQQVSSHLEVALSSSDRIEAKAGERIAFPVVIDATEALPAHSIVSINALPVGASFSSGRPYGDTGWSLRPDEIGDLLGRQLPAQSGVSHIRLELVAGDGTVLAQSETQVGIGAPQHEVATDAATTSALPEESAKVALAKSVADLPPPPERKTSSRGADEAAVKVNTVKVVTIEPPRQKRTHDGAYALGSPADAAAASTEWMETKTAVDMHANAQQSSETVKVADKGIKLRVTARDKNWIQVSDPASLTTGWIYNRFLKPTDPPAQ